MTLTDAVKIVVARKRLEHRHPAIATEREVYALRGVTTTVEEIEGAKEVLQCGRTFYENYYKLLN